MTRILADLPDEDIDKLDALGASQKRSRASLLREAIRLFLAQTTDDIFNSSPLLRMRSGDWKGLHARIEYLTGLFSLDEGSTIVGSR